MPHSRITWIDSMKAFSIIAVVLYHTPCSSEIKAISYILCLPAFFFAAGICSDTNMSPLAFFHKKTLRLLIPYILWGFISWIAWLFIARRYGQDESTETWWLPIAGMLCGRVEMLPHNRPLWFLCCMMSVEWLYYMLCLFKHRAYRWIGTLCLAIAGCILSHYHINGLWEITAAMLVLPIYMVGAKGREWWQTKTNALEDWSLIGLLILSIIGICIGYIFNPMFHISTCQVGNPMLFYLTVFSAVGVWLSTALLLDKHVHKMRVLPFIGQHTLLVLCVHIPTFGLIKGIALLCHVSLDFFNTPGGCVCLLCATFILLVPLSYAITKYCPILLGKRTTPESVS